MAISSNILNAASFEWSVQSSATLRTPPGVAKKTAKSSKKASKVSNVPSNRQTYPCRSVHSLGLVLNAWSQLRTTTLSERHIYRQKLVHKRVKANDLLGAYSEICLSARQERTPGWTFAFAEVMAQINTKRKDQPKNGRLDFCNSILFYDLFTSSDPSMSRQISCVSSPLFCSIGEQVRKIVK